MKPNQRIPLVVAAVIVLAVVAGTFIQRGRGGGEDQAMFAAETVADAGTQPMAAPPAPGRTGATAGAGSARTGMSADPMERRTQLREEHAARTRALREQSMQRYDSEQVDPAWAPQKETELTGLANMSEYGTAAARPQSLSIDCRSSMCRLDGQFESSGKAEDWILMYMSSVGSAMPNSVVSRTRNPDGTTRVEIYGRAR